jgi:Secretion system C-terminal sorting domain
MLMRSLFLSVLCFWNIQLFAQETWQQTSFPLDNFVYFITAQNDKLFAGSHNGLFSSSDAGDTWQQRTPEAVTGVNTLIFKDGYYYIAAWSGGVYRSADLSIWETIGEGLPPMVSSIAFYNNELYAATLNSVYKLHAASNKWESDKLWIKTIHNKTIFDLKTYNGDLYAAGCNYFYKKTGDNAWIALDTSYQFCAVKILQAGLNLMLNNTGNGVHKWSPNTDSIEQSIVIDPQDPYSQNASDIVYQNNELYVLSDTKIYAFNAATAEHVCDNRLTALTFAENNAFVGTHNQGIWKKAWPQLLQPDDRAATPSKNTNLQLEIYPSPAADRFVANCQIDKEHSARIAIFDLTGKLVYQEPVFASGDLSLRLPVPGVYMALLTNGEKRVIKKVVIQ